MTLTALTGPALFDGATLRRDAALLLQGPRVAGLVNAAQIPSGAQRLRLDGGILAPGLIDLQVNGGGGLLLNDDPTFEAMGAIAAAHARLGTTAILPTLITDAPHRTKAAIAAARRALAEGLPGVAGLHLEGPHLSIRRKGAHDPALIRPMEEPDAALLLEAARAIPALMITVATESVTPPQIARLSAAGIVVSLGHTEATYEQAEAAARAGARCATHLFNAMSQMTPREPGLVGAVLEMEALSAGFIADGHHVHPAAARAALRAKRGPGAIFFVSDAMATVGSDLTEFRLNGRRVLRAGGRLTLEDGTLAGADIDLLSAVRYAVRALEMTPEEALARASRVPAALMGLTDRGILAPGARADLIHVSDDLELRAVWRDGRPLA